MEIVSTYGEIKMIGILVERMHPHLSKGYAYMEFENPDEAKKALKHMDGQRSLLLLCWHPGLGHCLGDSAHPGESFCYFPCGVGHPHRWGEGLNPQDTGPLHIGGPDPSATTAATRTHPAPTPPNKQGHWFVPLKLIFPTLSFVLFSSQMRICKEGSFTRVDFEDSSWDISSAGGFWLVERGTVDSGLFP